MSPRPLPRRAILAAWALWLLVAFAPPAAAQGDPGVPPADGAQAERTEIGYVEGTIRRIVAGERADRAVVELPDGRVIEANLPGPEPFGGGDDLPPFEVGDRVEVYYAPSPDADRSYVVSDWVRRPALAGLVAAFLLASIAVAGFKGLRAFVATGASLALIIGFVVPAITGGANAVLVSLAGVGGILVLAIYFVHGVSWSTTAALIGTFLAAAATLGLGVAAADLAHLTGYGSEDAAMIAASLPDVNLRGLMLAGLLIGALGALTDITIVQASVVRELAHADPDMRSLGLYRRGMNVGRDHIGSLVNTLVLAYTGAALPLLVLLGQGELPLARAVNLELIAAEVVHTLVGSIGLILAVPLTTFIAAAMFRGGRLPLKPGELEHGHTHGHGHDHGSPSPTPSVAAPDPASDPPHGRRDA